MIINSMDFWHDFCCKNSKQEFESKYKKNQLFN